MIMDEYISLTDRANRLKQITQDAVIAEDRDLIKVLSLQENSHKKINNALNYFLWCCLTTYFKQKIFICSDNLLNDYQEEIFQLPNITPNGLVLPKKENQLAYNLLHFYVAEAFKLTNLGNYIERIQFPVNVRLQNGITDSKVDNRQRASVIPHSDIWAGDPAAGIMVFLYLTGSVDKVGVRFLRPKVFPQQFARQLENFKEGAALVEDAVPMGHFNEKGWFLIDPYVIHHTIKTGEGIRISLDFRFIPKELIASDFDEDQARSPYFIDFQQWLAIGSQKLIITEESMFDSFNDKEPYTVGYPVNLKIKDVV